MKLETILNAYGEAERQNGSLGTIFETYSNMFDRGFLYYTKLSKRRERQVEKFKERLLEKIVEIDTDNGLSG